MIDIPERIFATIRGGIVFASSNRIRCPYAREYIRADLATASDEIAQLRRENEKLRMFIKAQSNAALEMLDK